jgi:hypothetical protein
MFLNFGTMYNTVLTVLNYQWTYVAHTEKRTRYDLRPPDCIFRLSYVNTEIVNSGSFYKVLNQGPARTYFFSTGAVVGRGCFNVPLGYLSVNKYDGIGTYPYILIPDIIIILITVYF